MQTKKSGLGRGLSAILEDADSTPAAGESCEIPLALIEPNPFQPRTRFDPESLQELAESIKALGVIQPITVRRLSAQAYQIISGERRFQAAKLAGLSAIPAYVRTADDEQMLEMALVENIQRQDLNPIEIALAYKRLMDECKLTIEQTAEKVGKKRPTVNNYLRLLRLPPEIQAGLKENKITMGHARALVSVDDPLAQLAIYKQIVEKDLSVREVEERVQRIGAPLPKTRKPSSAPASAFEVQLKAVRESLESKFMTRVRVNAKENGGGEISIKFYSPEDLNRVLEILGV
ncbi:MAG: ParB/RepB/Spo0J family partition protein [Bacteroidia bacterium]|nr:ParB/RepB/Spo0J family partition protein [Bacteroidia bacterium]MDW8333560.1 ParB/RepB/Spo0J family partition protein [Bacteroidia bacterium]